MEKDVEEEFGGAKYYLPPERVAGKPYSQLDEVWSVGITLVELGTGRHPYPSAIDECTTGLKKTNNDEELRLLAKEY
ncbi:MKK2 protein [Aphelenchoides avenae]|nr:MKK2 protein [Aphelenchus avenae]